jgi:hypothetical protein
LNLIVQAREKIKVEKVAMGFKQKASGLVLKTTGSFMYHCVSGPT